jgi:hypothetical protein
VIRTGSPTYSPTSCALAFVAIACGYEDADDLDRLRCDPAFTLACGRVPDSGTDLRSQPTFSRWRTRLRNERCFLPIHVYDTATARPVAILLRPGKTPSGHQDPAGAGAGALASANLEMRGA